MVWTRCSLAGALALAGLAVACAGDAPLERAAPATLAPEPDTDRAIAHLEARVASQPGAVVERVALARLLLRRAKEQDAFGDYRLAEEEARAVLAVVPDHVEARHALIDALQAQHAFAPALALARGLHAADPDDMRALAALFDCLLARGDYAEAEPRLEALLARGRSPAVLARLGRWQELHGRPDEAIVTLREARDGASRSSREGRRQAWYAWRLGSLHASVGDLEAADAAFARGLALAPEDAASLAGLAGVRASQQRFDEATALYERSLAVREAPPVLWELGELWEARGERDRAARWYARAETLIREEAAGPAGDAHRREAARFFADRRRDTTFAVAKARADAAERRDVYTWDALAWALFAEGRLEEASEAARESLRLGTRDAWLHYHAGRIALAREEREAGRRHLETALALRPGFSPLHAAHARALLRETS